MNRRLFDHLYAEISVSVGIRIPRYALWLRIHELGWNPDEMGRVDALTFLDDALLPWLDEWGLLMNGKTRKQLRRRVSSFNPEYPTPYERIEAWGRTR